mgnify:FL=1
MICMLATLVGLWGQSAQAQEQAVEISGYVSTVIDGRYRPNATPEFQRELGFRGSRAGLTFTGRPLDDWSFKSYFYLGGETLNVLTNAGAVDTNNDGSVDTIATDSATAVTNFVREATLSWHVSESTSLKMGRLRIPFTSQAQSPDTALMFPDRAGPNAVFLEGTDLGSLLSFVGNDSKFVGSMGLFNGTGQGVGRTTQLGVLYTGRMDINPLGAFALDESGPGIGPFRWGFGAGFVYHPYTSYDSGGYSAISTHDVRGSASLRFAGRGLHFLTEALFRYEMDSLRNRPNWASGAFSQISWFLANGIEPSARMGWAAEDQSFAPRHTVWIDGGLNMYPGFAHEPADIVKVSAHYLGEYRLTERDIAHGLSVQMQITW